MARPTKKGYAMTGAERTRDYRARRKGAIDAATVQECFCNAIGKSRLHVPAVALCYRVATLISLCVPDLKRSPENRRNWVDSARIVALAGAIAWLGKPRSLKEGAPICVFVHSVMKHLGYSQTKSAISAALRGRRGGLPRLNLYARGAQPSDPEKGDTHRLPNPDP